MALGKVDILIGTHRLLTKDIRFKNLGLAIIDEEQKFGVRQKERFKELRAEVDILSLSATPIPRTLQFVLSKLRDSSQIETPPKGRIAIKTYVLPHSKKIIQEVAPDIAATMKIRNLVFGGGTNSVEGSEIKFDVKI